MLKCVLGRQIMGGSVQWWMLGADTGTNWHQSRTLEFQEYRLNRRLEDPDTEAVCFCFRSGGVGGRRLDFGSVFGTDWGLNRSFVKCFFSKPDQWTSLPCSQSFVTSLKLVIPKVRGAGGVLAVAVEQVTFFSFFFIFHWTKSSRQTILVTFLSTLLAKNQDLNAVVFMCQIQTFETWKRPRQKPKSPPSKKGSHRNPGLCPFL